MRFINIIDEKGRFVGLKVFPDEPAGQQDSHAYSYLFAREQYKSMGDVMGLESELNVEEKENER